MMDTTDMAQRTGPSLAPPRSDGQSSRPAHLWLWLILALVGGLIVLGVAVFFAASSALNTIKQTGPIPTRYYLAIIDRNYARAYTDLDSGATIAGRRVDERAFITLATRLDQRDGPVHGAVIENGGDASSRVTLNVQRNSGSYTVHLLLRQEGGTEKIVSADRI